MVKTTDIRQRAEVRFADELERLAKSDDGPRPDGWHLSPRMVRSFVLGDPDLGVTRKFYGDDQLIERCIVTLMSNRGLLLVGEPGTAKSMLSELFAAAISKNSTLTVQGTAGATEDRIIYSWNYALLIADGPSPAALVPGPVLRGLTTGSIVRVEEITRIQPEVQDSLISVLSEKLVVIPQLDGEHGEAAGQRGFNLIATANLRDRGVHEISSALKRRFNFETVRPISDRALETRLITDQTNQLLREANLDTTIAPDVMELLIDSFNDLRSGLTADGISIETPSTVMSTAEAVAVSYSAALDAFYLGDGHVTGTHIGRQMIGTVLKDNADDIAKLRHWLDVVVKRRSGRPWKDLYAVRQEI
jgi:MoxR-like ATPase